MSCDPIRSDHPQGHHDETAREVKVDLLRLANAGCGVVSRHRRRCDGVELGPCRHARQWRGGADSCRTTIGRFASCQRLDSREVGDLDQAFAELQHHGVLPDLKLFVDALPRGADDSRQLLLRQAQGHPTAAGARGAARQPHQRLRHTVPEPPIHRLLDVPVGLAQALAKDFHEQDAEIATTFEKRHEIEMIDDKELAVGDRSGVRGAILPVDQCDFAEHLAGVEMSWPVGAGALIRTVPERIAIMLRPGEPLANISRPAG
jgi:hypothetical protein